LGSSSRRRATYWKKLESGELQRIDTCREFKQCVVEPVPRLPVARRELPDRVVVLVDVAHVRRGRVLRSLSRACTHKSRLVTAT
jgi:hypothetical protein